MTEFLYKLLLGFSVMMGWTYGPAGDGYSKWFFAPIAAIMFGATVRMFWGKP